MSSTLSPAQIQKVVEILTSARMDKQVKLRFGYRQRDAMVAKMKANETMDPTDHRYAWLKETRDGLVAYLGTQGHKFNTANPHDCVSLQDFLDALNSTMLLVKAKMDE